MTQIYSIFVRFRSRDNFFAPLGVLLLHLENYYHRVRVFLHAHGL